MMRSMRIYVSFVVDGVQLGCILFFGIDWKGREMFVKIKHERDFYLIRGDRVKTLERLIEVAEEQFEGLPQHYVFFYDDEDGDSVTVQNQKNVDVFQADMKQFGYLMIGESSNSHLNLEMIQEIRRRVKERKASIKNKEKNAHSKHNRKRQQRNNSEQELKERVRSESNAKYEQIDKRAVFQAQIKQRQKLEQMQPFVQNTDFVVHENIRCNQCQEMDIIGVRFRCITCKTFNLCQNCKEKSTHPKSHQFQSIRIPQAEEEVKQEEATEFKFEEWEMAQNFERKEVSNNKEPKRVEKFEQLEKERDPNQQKAQTLSSILQLSKKDCLEMVRKYQSLTTEQIVQAYFLLI